MDEDIMEFLRLKGELGALRAELSADPVTR